MSDSVRDAVLGIGSSIAGVILAVLGPDVLTFVGGALVLLGVLFIARAREG